MIFSNRVPFWYSSMAERPREYPPHPCLHLFVLTPFSHIQDPPQQRPSSSSGLPMQPPENLTLFDGMFLLTKKEKNLHGFPPPTPHPSPNVLADPGEFHGLRFHLHADPDNLYGT